MTPCAESKSIAPLALCVWGGGVDTLPLRATPLAVALVCHVLAFLHFRVIFPLLRVPGHWFTEFEILLGISLGISVGLFFIRREHLLIWVLLLQNLICFLMGVPEVNILQFKFTLLALLIVESTIYLPFPKGFFPVGVSLAFWLLGLRETTAWFQTIPAARFIDRVVFTVFAVGLVAMGSLARVYFEKFRRESAIRGMLDQSILTLTGANIGFQRYATNVEERSSTEERRRVTREIHDSVGYAMTNLNMMLEEALDLAPASNTKLTTLLERAGDQARTALNVTRYSLQSLRSIEMAEVEGLRRIQRLAKAFEEATRVSVSVEYGNVPWSFGEEHDSVVFGIIQEGVTNAFRHGKATRISIKLWLIEDETIQVVVHDNGKGVENIVEGIGFSGMRERLAKFNGRLEAKNAVDGFEVIAWIPWTKGRGNVETSESSAGG